MFWRLYQQTKEILEEQGGYVRPLAHLFWRDGRDCKVDMTEKDADNLQVGQFLCDLDHFCAEKDVHVAYVCFPLPEKQRYLCILTGLEWNGGGMARIIFLRQGVAIEADHDLRQHDQHEEFFSELRLKARFYNKENIGRC